MGRVQRSDPGYINGRGSGFIGTRNKIRGETGLDSYNAILFACALENVGHIVWKRLVAASIFCTNIFLQTFHLDFLVLFCIIIHVDALEIGIRQRNNVQSFIKESRKNGF